MIWNQKRIQASVLTAALVLLLCAGVMASPNTRNRDSIPDQYKWDFTDIYPDWDAWQAGLTRLQELMDEFAGLKGTLSQGPQALLHAADVSDELDMLSYKVYRYPALQNEVNSRDDVSAGHLQEVQIAFSKFGIATAWYSPELLSIPWDTMKVWLDNTPALNPYRYGIEDLYRQQEHVLSADKEQLIAYYRRVNAAPSTIFDRLSVTDIKYPETALSDGDSITLSPGVYYNILSTNRNHDDRAKAFETFYKTYYDFRNTYAAIFNGVLQSDWATAQARNYGSCLEMYLNGDNVPLDVYTSLVETVRNGVEPLHRYYRLRKERLGLDEYHLYDGSVPIVDFDKEYPYDDIQKWIIEAVKPLGKDYQKQLEFAFNNRWIDVYENEGKSTGAYSAPTYGVHPFLLLNYNETMSDVFTTAHELGHCMHNILSSENQPFVTANPTIFVAEVASTMNEAFLLDYMLDHTKDPKERITLLTHAIDDLDGTFYTQSMWADFEMRLHGAVEQGMPITAESIREIYSGIQQEYYGDAVTVDDYYKFVWTRIGHFYGSPFYVYKYATCYATSAQLFDEITSDDSKMRKDALKRYMTLLKSGSSDYPMELIKTAGVDLSQPASFQAIVDRLDHLVTLLEAELAKL